MARDSRVRMAAVLCAIALAGCTEFPSTVVGDNVGDPGLAQRVSLSSAEPLVGDSLVVRSVIMNQTSAPITIGYGCMRHGLGLDGVAFNWDNDITCEGYQILALAPGDSLVRQVITAPITSPPGDYTLGVCQMNTPQQCLRVRVRVRRR